MVVSRRSALALCGIVAGTGLLAAVVMTPTASDASTTAASPADRCSATAHVDSQWGTGAGSGQVVTVTVVNASAAPATKWAVTWTLGAGQRIAAAWNATVSTVGTAATAVNAAYNGVLAPGGSTTFGMQLWGPVTYSTLSCSNDASAPTGTGSPSVTPPSEADILVTRDSNRVTVDLFVGQTLGVALGRDYLPLTVSGTALAPLSSGGGYPSGRPLSAMYRAVAPGSVDITTHTDHACLHTTPPCALPVALWTVHVNVVAVRPPGQTVTVTTADNQTTVRLKVGDRLVVSLPQGYAIPTITPAGVLTSGLPANETLVTSHLAVAPGEADVSSRASIGCSVPTRPCPEPTAVLWTIHVTVTA